MEILKSILVLIFGQTDIEGVRSQTDIEGVRSPFSVKC